MPMTEIIKAQSPVPLTEKQLGLMNAVYEKLEEKNRVMNLTSIKTAEEAAELQLAHAVDQNVGAAVCQHRPSDLI